MNLQILIRRNNQIASVGIFSSQSESLFAILFNFKNRYLPSFDHAKTIQIQE